MTRGTILKWHPFSLRNVRLWALSLIETQIDKLVDSLQSAFLFVVLHLIAFYFHYFFCKILEILCVVVAFCFLLLFEFFLFWLFCYLGVRFFFFLFWFIYLFWIFEYENRFNPNYYFCYLSCCCSCLINILGGERFGCLTNSDTMEVESFFF